MREGFLEEVVLGPNGEERPDNRRKGPVADVVSGE